MIYRSYGDFVNKYSKIEKVSITGTSSPELCIWDLDQCRIQVDVGRFPGSVAALPCASSLRLWVSRLELPARDIVLREIDAKCFFSLRCQSIRASLLPRKRSNIPVCKASMVWRTGSKG